LIVEITNITDGPGHKPTQVDIYNKTIDPGVSIKLPAELVDQKVRALEKQGLICIGQVPAWYLGSKMRKGRVLTTEEQQKRITKPVPPPLVTAVSKAPEIKKETPKDPTEEVPEELSGKRRR
jgi:hypothetical protein